MSQENVELVRELLEAFGRRDHERAFDFYDPDEPPASAGGAGHGLGNKSGRPGAVDSHPLTGLR